MATDAQALRAPPCCTIVEAETFRQDLLARICDETPGPIHIDLSAVEEADITLIQIMLSAEKTASAGGRSLCVTSSGAVADLLSRTGLPGWPMPSGL